MRTVLSMETGMVMDYERVGHLFTTKRPIVKFARLSRSFGKTESIKQ